MPLFSRHQLLRFALVTFLVHSPTRESEAAASGRITVHVVDVDTGAPLNDAQVFLADFALEIGATSEGGDATILPSRDRRTGSELAVLVSRDGWMPQTIICKVPGRDIVIRVALQRIVPFSDEPVVERSKAIDKEAITIWYALQKLKRDAEKRSKDQRLDQRDSLYLRYQVLRARLGDLWITPTDESSNGYEHRATDIYVLYEWDRAPARAPTEAKAAGKADATKPYRWIFRGDETLTLAEPAVKDSAIPRIIARERDWLSYNSNKKELRPPANIADQGRFRLRLSGTPTDDAIPIRQKDARRPPTFEGDALAVYSFNVPSELVISGGGKVIVETLVAGQDSECPAVVFTFNSEARLQGERNLHLFVGLDAVAAGDRPHIAYDVLPWSTNFSLDPKSYVQFDSGKCTSQEGLSWETTKKNKLGSQAKNSTSVAGWLCDVPLVTRPTDKKGHAPLFVVYLHLPFPGCRDVRATRAAILRAATSTAVPSKSPKPGPTGVTAPRRHGATRSKP